MVNWAKRLDLARAAGHYDASLDVQSLLSLLGEVARRDTQALYNDLCDQARELVEDGDLEAARRVYAEANRIPGLGWTSEDEELWQMDEARIEGYAR